MDMQGSHNISALDGQNYNVLFLHFLINLYAVPVKKNNLTIMDTQFSQDTFWNSILFPMPPLELMDFEGGYERDLCDTDFLVRRPVSHLENV